MKNFPQKKEHEITCATFNTTRNYYCNCGAEDWNKCHDAFMNVIKENSEYTVDALKTCRIIMNDRAENITPSSFVNFFLLETIIISLYRDMKNIAKEEYGAHTRTVG